VDFDFFQPAEWVEAAGFGRDKLHVFEEDRDHGEAGLLSDVVEAGLARADVKAIAASAFGKNNQMKVSGSTAKVLKFTNAAGIEPAAFEKEADAAAEEPLNP
jgi:hypothetical protein